MLPELDKISEELAGMSAGMAVTLAMDSKLPGCPRELTGVHVHGDRPRSSLARTSFLDIWVLQRRGSLRISCSLDGVWLNCFCGRGDCIRLSQRPGFSLSAWDAVTAKIVGLYRNNKFVSCCSQIHTVVFTRQGSQQDSIAHLMLGCLVWQHVLRHTAICSWFIS